MNIDWFYRITIYFKENNQVVALPIANFTQDENGKLTAKNGYLTVEGNITRKILSSANDCSLTIYNLSLKTRERIYHEPYRNTDPNYIKRLKIEVGYGDLFPLQEVFYGIIQECYTEKAGGSPEIKTIINANNNLTNLETSLTFADGVTKEYAFKQIVSQIPKEYDISIGNYGGLTGEFKSAVVFDGKILDQLQKLTGGNVYIDNQKIQNTLLNQVIENSVPVLKYDDWLLEAPVRKGMSLNVKSILLPFLNVGQFYQIQSKINPVFDGQYKVNGFTHNFVFSPTKSGNRISDISFQILNLLPANPISITEGKPQETVTKVKDSKVTALNASGASSVIDIYNEIQKTGGQVPNKQATKNLSWAELIGHSNTNNDRLKELTIEKLANIYETAKIFQGFLDKYFYGNPVKINSGWRSTANNSSCGGASSSKHLSGLALDIGSITGFSQTEVKNIIRKNWTYGFIQDNYKTSSHIHIDIRNAVGIARDV